MAKSKKKNKKPNVDLDTALSNELVKMSGLRSDIQKSGDIDLQAKADAVLRKGGDEYLRMHSQGYLNEQARREAEAARLPLDRACGPLVRPPRLAFRGSGPRGPAGPRAEDQEGPRDLRLSVKARGPAGPQGLRRLSSLGAPQGRVHSSAVVPESPPCSALPSWGARGAPGSLLRLPPSKAARLRLPSAVDERVGIPDDAKGDQRSQR